MTLIQRSLILTLAVGSLAACSGMSNQDQRTLSGGAIGAGVGAVGTAIVGGPVLLGAAVGAVGGAAIGALTTPGHN
jgi:osmotically inducible lipoprotein OsmB